MRDLSHDREMTSLSTASGLGMKKGVCPLFQHPVRLVALSFYSSMGILEQFNTGEQSAQLRASRARSAVGLSGAGPRGNARVRGTSAESGADATAARSRQPEPGLCRATGGIP